VSETRRVVRLNSRKPMSSSSAATAFDSTERGTSELCAAPTNDFVSTISQKNLMARSLSIPPRPFIKIIVRKIETIKFHGAALSR
jgi:hypothetical protein